MNRPHHLPALRLAAIDLDGTLLGPDREISEDNRVAVERLAKAGLEVVLASGRHYRSMLGYAEKLPEVKWIVSSQGGEVSRSDRSSILARKFLREGDVRALMEASRRRGLSSVYYGPDQVVATGGAREDLDGYAAVSGLAPGHVSPGELLEMPVHKVLWWGPPGVIAGLYSDRSLDAFGLQGVRTESRIFEFMPVETSKASALEILAADLGLTAKNVVAFGDGDNDIPMFDWAGTSFAMPHGSENARARATRVAPCGPPHAAFARAVDLLLS